MILYCLQKSLYILEISFHSFLTENRVFLGKQTIFLQLEICLVDINMFLSNSPFCHGYQKTSWGDMDMILLLLLIFQFFGSHMTWMSSDLLYFNSETLSRIHFQLCLQLQCRRPAAPALVRDRTYLSLQLKINGRCHLPHFSSSNASIICLGQLVKFFPF